MGAALNLAVCTLLMLAAPLAVFHGVSTGRFDSLLDPLLTDRSELSPASRLLAGGVAGVLCANLVIVVYVWAAWREPAPPGDGDSHAKHE